MSRFGTMTEHGPGRRAGGRRGALSRVLATSLATLLVWSGVAPGIAAAQGAGGTPLAVTHEPLTSGVAGEPLSIEARVTSTGARPFVVLHHRTGSEGAYRDDIMPRVGSDRYLRELPTEAGATTRIEYWIEASSDEATAGAGSADAPLVVEVAPAEAAPPAVAADTRAPVITDRSSANAVAGERQRFEVDVTDDGEIDEVVLFHRAGGDAEFERLPMRSAGGDRYVATLPSVADASMIEYFVEARDASGNRESLGSRFMTLERPLDAVAETSDGADEPIAEPRSRTLWYVLGGALLIGAVAAAAGGGGDDDGGDTGECCAVTIEVDAPQ